MFLFQFIVFYFVHIAKLHNIVFLHCLSRESLFQLAHLTRNATFFTQFWHLAKISLEEEQLQDQLLNHKLTKLAIYLDINCNGSSSVLDMAYSQRLFTDRYHWLIYDNNFNLIEINERFAEAQLYFHTELTYVKQSRKLNSFILYDMYNKAKHLGAKLNITIDQQIECNADQCYVKRYLSELHKRPRLQHRRLLTGLTVRINSAVTSLPLDSPEWQIKEFLSSPYDTYKDPFARLGYQTYQVLRDMLDCNYSFIFRDRWTDSEVTGGLIGDLRDGSVDLTATAFLYTSGRAKYLKILSWHCSFRCVCMFRNPRSALAELRITEFLQPFSWSVWLMFSALLFFAGFLLWLTFQLEFRLNRKRSISLRPSLLTTCLLSFGAACIQGAWLLPRSTGGRMVFFATMLTCFLMYNYYTSIVVSTLLGDPPKSGIRTIQQLADSKLEVSVEPTPYTKVYVETSNYSDVLSLYRKKILNSRRDPQRIWLSSEQGVLMVRNNPGFVFVAEAASAYVFVRKHYLPHEICELNEILLRDETTAYTMVSKTSSFAELIRLNQMRLLETGIHYKHFNYWIRSKLHCYKGNMTVVVGLETAGPLFLLLLGAYIICLLVLGLEILWHRPLQLAQQFHQATHLIYHQFVHLSQWSWEHLEERYLDHLQPTLGIYVDLKCLKTRALLIEASRTHLYNQHYHWLLHGSMSDLSFYNYFKPFNISVDADVSYVKQDRLDHAEDFLSYSLYDVYSNGNHIGGRLNITGDYEVYCNASFCHLHRYLSTLHLRSKYGNREQLRDVVLRVATVVTKRPISWPPEMLLRFLSQENETHIDAISRFGFQISMILKDQLQCGMNYIFKDRWSTTDFIGGSVGAVVDQSADIGSAPCLATEGRLRHLSAIIETGYFRSVCIFRTPHNAGIQSVVFLQPFSALVWYIFAGFLILIALLLWLIFYMECKRMSRRWRLAYVPSLLNTFLISFGAACIQSSSLIPRSTGGRLTYFALFLISFIMYNYYTSVVVSSLLNSPVKSNIKTVQQLAESSLTVGLEPLSFTKSYLNYSTRPEIHLLSKRKIETQSKNPELWLPAEEGILRVRDNPGYVFVFEASSGYAYVERYYTQQEICDLNEILFRPELLLYTHLHRNSSYKELVRYKLMRLLETGIYRKHRMLWARMKLHCYSQNFVITVGMEYVAPLFFMLICGYILVLLLLMMELAWQRYVQPPAAH